MSVPTATLTTSSLTLGIGGLTYPFTIAFNSSAGGRLVELSADGINYFTPEYDVTASGQLVVTVSAPIAKMRFTGTVGDEVYLTTERG